MNDPARPSAARKAKAAKGIAKTRPSLLSVRSILVPLDFSPSSQKALGHAVAFARRFKAKLTLLHVVEPIATPDFAASFPLAMEDGKMRAAVRNGLEGVVKAARVPHGMVEKLLVRFGRPFHQIADTARTRKADLILISTHGHTGLKHVLLGSTTERVVRHAPCPVLVVRDNGQEPPAA